MSFRHGWCIRCGHFALVKPSRMKDANLCLSCIGKAGKDLPLKSGSIKERVHTK